jgi:hypothetical protein
VTIAWGPCGHPLREDRCLLCALAQVDSEMAGRFDRTPHFNMQATLVRTNALIRWRGRKDEANAWTHFISDEIAFDVFDDQSQRRLEADLAQERSEWVEEIPDGTDEFVMSVVMRDLARAYTASLAEDDMVPAAICERADLVIGHTSRDLEEIGALPGRRYNHLTGEPTRPYLNVRSVGTFLGIPIFTPDFLPSHMRALAVTTTSVDELEDIVRADRPEALVASADIIRGLWDDATWRAMPESLWSRS